MYKHKGESLRYGLLMKIIDLVLWIKLCMKWWKSKKNGVQVTYPSILNDFIAIRSSKKSNTICRDMYMLEKKMHLEVIYITQLFVNLYSHR